MKQLSSSNRFSSNSASSEPCLGDLDYLLSQQPNAIESDGTATDWKYKSPSFETMRQHLPLYSSEYMDPASNLDVKLEARLDKGFFLAGTVPNLEWTCYRRNYFSLAAGFHTLDANESEYSGPFWVNVNNQPMKVSEFTLGIHAQNQNGDKNIPIIQLTAKRDKGPQMIPQNCTIVPGGSPFAMSYAHTGDSIALYDRLQFKVSNASGGRRRTGLFILVVSLYAVLEHGQTLLLSTLESCLLVVRGQSPSQYLDIDIPSGIRNSSKKSSMTPLTAIDTPSLMLSGLLLQSAPEISNPNNIYYNHFVTPSISAHDEDFTNQLYLPPFSSSQSQDINLDVLNVSYTLSDSNQQDLARIDSTRVILDPELFGNLLNEIKR